MNRTATADTRASSTPIKEHSPCRVSVVCRHLLAYAALASAACIPDLGTRLQQGQGEAGVASTDGSIVPTGDGSSPTSDASDAVASDSPPPDSSLGPLCDSSPPSQTVDRYVWGEGFTFFFTPAGANIKTLYVPANALVNFSLATSPNEEAHIFKIVIPDCQTGPVGMGGQGSEAHYAWKSPKVAATYKAGGDCDNHTGMDFDIVVTP